MQSLLIICALTAGQANDGRGGPAPDDQSKPAPKKEVRLDDIGDPLPEGAVARIGTTRLRQPSEVCSVAFSFDGKLLATGGRYDGVRLWDSTGGKLLQFLPAEGGQGIFYLSFSPNNLALVSSGTDGALEVWNVPTGKKIRRLAGATGRLGPFCFSDDGKFLAVASREGMRVWETENWTEQVADKSVLTSFAGKRIYVGNEKGKDHIWDLGAMEKRVVPDSWRTGYWTTISHDGKRLATSESKAPAVVLRDIDTGEEVRRVELSQNKEARVNGLCYSPDGKQLVVGGRGVPMRCIDSQTGKEIIRFGDQEVDYASQLAFSADGKRLAVAKGQGICVWDVGTGKEVLPRGALLQNVRAIAFSPDGKQIAFGDGDWLCLVDATTHKQIWRHSEDRDSAQHIAFAPDGKSLVAGSVSRLRFRDAKTGKVTHSWGDGLPGYFKVGDSIELGLFTPDLEKVASLRIATFGNPGQDVLVRSAKSGKELLKFQRQGELTTAAAISPNGQLMAIGDWEGPVRLYSLRTGKTVGQLETDGTEWHCLAFAPDGRSLLSLDSNRTRKTKPSLQLLEVATGKQRCAFPSGGRGGFACSADGKTLAIWAEKSVELYSALTGRKLGQLEGHTGPVNQAAFAPRGTILATASADTTILFWDIAGLLREAAPKELAAEALLSTWKDLADADAVPAFRAMASLHSAGPQAVLFLRQHVRPAQAPDAKAVERWLADLSDEIFAVRNEASIALEKHGDCVLSALRKALAAKPPLESQRRLAKLIDSAESRWTPDALRTLRAIEILEHIGSAEARSILKTLSGGASEARVTGEAKASLDRLER